MGAHGGRSETVAADDHHKHGQEEARLLWRRGRLSVWKASPAFFCLRSLSLLGKYKGLKYLDHSLIIRLLFLPG